MCGSLLSNKNIQLDERKIFYAHVGILLKFLWPIMLDMQKFAGKPSLALNEDRKEFSHKLCDSLFIDYADIEHAMVSIMIIYPTPMQKKS